MPMDLDPVLTPVRDIGAFIREQRTAARISVRALAAKAGMSNPYLSQVERGLRRPSADILVQIAHALSISVESLLARAGILDTSEAPDVVAAIRSDELLTERHKAALIDIYAAFRCQAHAAMPNPVLTGPPPAAGEHLARQAFPVDATVDPAASDPGPEPGLERSA